MQLESILIGAFSLLLLVLAQALFKKQREHETARRLGCKAPNRYPHSLPWGIDLFRERVAAVKAGRYNRLFQDHFNKYGTTFEERTFGIRTINTTETANIQTVAALKFNDYGKNATRNKAMMPFLGRGIFSEDGPAWKRSRDLIKPLFKRAELSDVEGFKKFVDRMLALIPRDGSTVDLKPLFEKLVRVASVLDPLESRNFC
jgi:cytochrome P450 monooxygenase